ncbi:hydrolase [candidate division KSB1 bacterium 4484_87]|nr:MAG: hydrolase [candidate division KSB1 bacterium 4484_87]
MKEFIFFLLVAANVLWGQNHPSKKMILHKTDELIRIDGKIEYAWSQADSSTDFVQFSPFHGKTPSVKTTVRLLATDDALFCLFVCQQKKEDIQRLTGVLDNFTGDAVSLMLDTFGNRRTAYKFAVSASGVRSDCLLLDDARDRDYNWDGIWFAQSKIYDWGYVVEIKIPFKSIQFTRGLDEWGLDFDRWVSSEKEDIYWCIYEENEGQRISKFGRLVFDNFKITTKSAHLEIYPVGITKVSYLSQKNYEVNPDFGLDVLFNPSEKINFQLTANPDFAQIEADPYEFNISRYESYFAERRPFFIEGNEIFKAAGRQRHSGFYRPLELFYSRRIGKKLPDGSEVPLLFGAKASGRIAPYEYGAFLALTGEAEYESDGEKQTEERAAFGSVRLKRQILNNSSVGLLIVNKSTSHENNGVIDVDGAFRGASWQLAYQLARSYKNNSGDFAASAGFTRLSKRWLALMRTRYVGENFDVDGVGFVPWRGTGELIAITGPRWYFPEGDISSILFYGGGILNYEKVDAFTDRGGLLGFNMQFRSNWGGEMTFVIANSKDENIRYQFYQANANSWFNISPDWFANFYVNFSKTYNFSRDYLAFYASGGGFFRWNVIEQLQVGTSVNFFVEGNKDNEIEEVTFNSRPFLSLTPVNNLNVRLYFDNVGFRSTKRFEQTIFGLLFSYNFSPKSWIYLAINEIRDCSNEYDSLGQLLPTQLHVVDRAGVLKIKYLYYF